MRRDLSWFSNVATVLDLQLPKSSVVEFGGPDVDGEPTDLERACSSGWTDLRRQQFAIGRITSRRAIAKKHGLCDETISFDHDGVPLWPRNVIGSISHKRTNCVAAIAGRAEVLELGIDLEMDIVDRDEQTLLREVCSSERERSHLAQFETIASPATLLLSAKEAFYKMQFPRSRTFLDWSDVEVSLDLSNSFRIVGRGEVCGRFVASSGWIACVSWIQAPNSPSLLRVV